MIENSESSKGMYSVVSFHPHPQVLKFLLLEASVLQVSCICFQKVLLHAVNYIYILSTFVFTNSSSLHYHCNCTTFFSHYVGGCSVNRNFVYKEHCQSSVTVAEYYSEWSHHNLFNLSLLMNIQVFLIFRYYKQAAWQL